MRGLHHARPLNEDWNNIHGASLDALKALAERYPGPRSGSSRRSISCGAADLAGARHHRLALHPDRPQEEAADRLRPRLSEKREGRGQPAAPRSPLESAYLIVSAPALQATPSCAPVAPLQPIAPMILPPSTSGKPPGEAVGGGSQRRDVAAGRRRHHVGENLGRPPEAGRGAGLADRDADRGDLGLIHLLQGDQFAVGVDHRDRELPVARRLRRFGDRRRDRLCALARSIDAPYGTSNGIWSGTARVPPARGAERAPLLGLRAVAKAANRQREASLRISLPPNFVGSSLVSCSAFGACSVTLPA